MKLLTANGHLIDPIGQENTGMSVLIFTLTKSLFIG